MNEETLLLLVSKFVEQLLNQVPQSWTEEERSRISRFLAEGAWNGLLILLRESLASALNVAFEDIGRF